LQLWVRDDNSGNLLSLSTDSRSYAQTRNSMAYVPVTAQTNPMSTSGDAADDPAIWVHPQQPQHSRILGTNKKAGLHLYDLNGHELQFIDAGRVNNVDVRQGFTLRGQPMDIAAASQRD